VLAVAFGLLWARDVTRDVREDGAGIEPETRVVARVRRPTDGTAPSRPTSRSPRNTRSRFLEASTLGLGRGHRRGRHAARCSASRSCRRSPTSRRDDADLGPLENFPQGEYVIATYLSTRSWGGEPATRLRPEQRAGGLGRAELHDPVQPLRPPRLPVQPNGPIDEGDGRR
jgi:hypothetical protein